MTLDNFRTLARAYVPGAKISVITNTILNLLINKGVDDVNEAGSLYPGDKKFDITADTADYNLNTILGDFLELDKPGIWWNEGTAASPNWIQLRPTTIKHLDEFKRNWRDGGSEDPFNYFVRGSTLTLEPKPDTTLTEGLWAYYIKTATVMTAGTQYPFSGSTTEITWLRPVDDAIIDYVRWKLSRPLGKTATGVITRKEYEETRDEKISLIGRRRDILPNRINKYRTPVARR